MSKDKKKNKKGSKTEESLQQKYIPLHRGERDPTEKGSEKKGSKTEESPQQQYIPLPRDQRDATEKGSKKKGSKTEESLQQQYIPLHRGERDPTEKGSVQENKTEERQEPGLEEECTPEKLARAQVIVEPWNEYDDTIAFIYNWMFAFILCLHLSSAFIALIIKGFLSFNYYGTLVVPASVLCVLFMVTALSARLALIKYPEFLTYIFKWAGITSYFVVGNLSVVLLWGNDLLNKIIIKEFWKIAPWICILWMISIISTGITWFKAYNRQKMKMLLLDFSSFILKHATVFCLLLSMLCIAISINGSILGIYFDDTFGKLMISICYIFIVGVISGCIALFSDSFKWTEYNDGVTWKMFTSRF